MAKPRRAVAVRRGAVHGNGPASGSLGLLRSTCAFTKATVRLMTRLRKQGVKLPARKVRKCRAADALAGRLLLQRRVSPADMTRVLNRWRRWRWRWWRWRSAGGGGGAGGVVEVEEEMEVVDVEVEVEVEVEVVKVEVEVEVEVEAREHSHSTFQALREE